MTAGTASPRASPDRRLSGGHLGRLALKELRETLRDRRTIVTLVLMPVLVYPLLSIAFQKLVLTSFAVSGAAGEEKYLVALGFDQDRHGDDLRRSVAQGGELLGENDGLVGYRIARDLEDSVARREVEVGARRYGTDERPGKSRSLGDVWELIYRDDAVSREALDYVERRLQAYGAEKLRKRVEDLSGAREPLPIVVHRTEVKRPEKGMAFSLSTLVPLILILMTITGAVYPAIDLTAGERERGTLEALIAAPVSRLGLLAAKYLAVLTVALMTAAVNLTAMTVTVYSVGLGPHLFGLGGLTLRMVLQVFGLLVLFAGFFSAVLLTVTSFARSFKEAQAYLIPLMLLAIAPGLLSMNENLKLNGALAVAPLVNMVLLGRDLFAGTASPLAAAMVVLSTFLFALAALAIAARVFGTDALLYGSQGTWSEAFRSPLEPQPTASVATALLCVAVLFPVFYNVQGLLGQFTDLTMNDRLWTNSLFTALLFGVFPVLVAAWRKVRLISGLGLRKPTSFLGVIGALLLGLSLWPWVYEVVVLQQRLGIGQLDPTLMRRIADMAVAIHQLPLALLLVTLAVVPASFEELFFRGLVYHSLAGKAKPYQAILVSGALFGLFHIFAFGALATTRLLPSTIMGLILGWVCYRSASIWPGILLHACHNGVALAVTHYVQNVDVASGSSDQTHLPWTWLTLAASSALLGAAMVARRSQALLGALLGLLEVAWGSWLNSVLSSGWQRYVPYVLMGYGGSLALFCLANIAWRWVRRFHRSTPGTTTQA